MKLLQKRLILAERVYRLFTGFVSSSLKFKQRLRDVDEGLFFAKVAYRAGLPEKAKEIAGNIINRCEVEAGNLVYTDANAANLYRAAELAHRYELPEAAGLYGRIIKAHEKAGRPEAAERVRMVAKLTKEQRENYIETIKTRKSQRNGFNGLLSLLF